MPTTVVKTVGTASRDYSTLQSWEDAMGPDLTASRSNTTVTGSTSSTIMLDALASATVSFYVGHAVWADARASEKRLITAYDGTTKVATVGALNGSSATWDNIPSIEAYTIDSTIWEGQCYNDSTFSGTATLLTMAGSTSSSTAYKHITAATGQSFADTSSNALRYNSANGVSLENPTGGYVLGVVIATEANARMSRLQVKNTPLNGYAADWSSGFIDRCILMGIHNQAAKTSGTVRNSLIVYTSNGGSTQAGMILGTGANAYNCTAVSIGASAGSGFTFSYGNTDTIRNCAAFGFALADRAANSPSATIITCYTDVVAPASGYTGSIPYTTATFVNLTSGSEDYKLAAGSSLLDVGTIDTTHAATDIFGTARPQGSAYDIGASERSIGTSRPGTVVTANGWSGSPENVYLFRNIDESAPSDVDTITSPPLDLTLSGAQAPAIFLLEDVDGTGLAAPRAAGSHTVPIRAKYVTAGGLVGTLQVRANLLDSGLAVVGTGQWFTCTATLTTFTDTITIGSTATHIQYEAKII